MRNLYLRNFRRCQPSCFDVMRLNHDVWSIIFVVAFLLVLAMLEALRVMA